MLNLSDIQTKNPFLSLNNNKVKPTKALAYLNNLCLEKYKEDPQIFQKLYDTCLDVLNDDVLTLSKSKLNRGNIDIDKIHKLLQ